MNSCRWTTRRAWPTRRAQQSGAPAPKTALSGAGGDGTLNTVAAAVLAGRAARHPAAGHLQLFRPALRHFQETEVAPARAAARAGPAVQVGCSMTGRSWSRQPGPVPAVARGPRGLQAEARPQPAGGIVVRAGHADARRASSACNLSTAPRPRSAHADAGRATTSCNSSIVGIPADELDRQRLIAMAAHPVGTLALYGLLLRGLFSRLGEAEQVVNFRIRPSGRLHSRPSPREGRDGRRNFLDEHPAGVQVAEDALGW